MLHNSTVKTSWPQLTFLVSSVSQDCLLWLPCHCSAGWNGRMKQACMLRMKHHLWMPQALFPAACWSKSSCGMWRNASTWRGSWKGNTGWPTAPWVSTGFRGTPGCGPSSPHQNYTSWSSCVPRSHLYTQPPCSPGVLSQPCHPPS